MELLLSYGTLQHTAWTNGGEIRISSHHSELKHIAQQRICACLHHVGLTDMKDSFDRELTTMGWSFGTLGHGA